MSLQRGMDGGEPKVGRLAGAQEEIRVARSTRLATGTLACPSCDAPVSPGGARLAPPDPLICPFCHHGGRVRDFLSLGEPSRPARVVVRVTGR